MARVLILDDDLAALSIARRAVRAAGHDAIAVTSAADACAALDAPQPPDVLIASPSADAGEALVLAERVRSDAAHSRTAVLLIGDARGASLPAIPLPLDGPSVGARIAEVLAARRAPPGAGSGTEAPPAPARPARRPATAAAEAALRSLFRRHTARPPEPSQPPPPATPAPVPDPARAAADGIAPPGDAIAARLIAGPPSRSRPPADLPSLVARARSADYFTVLAVARAAPVGAVRDAAAQLLADLDARLVTLQGDDSREAEDLRDARQVVLDARDVLTDEELRRAYSNAIDDVAERSSS